MLIVILLFRLLCSLFMVNPLSRCIVQFGVTSYSTDVWASQLLPDATPYSDTPKFLIRDRDSKYGQAFARVAKHSSIEIPKTPYPAPKANAICERFLGSVGRECLNRVLISGESHMYRLIKDAKRFGSSTRPDHTKASIRKFRRRALL